MNKRDRILTLREGYRIALQDTGYNTAIATLDAEKKYPYPTKKVAQIAHTTSGQYKIEDGIVYHRPGNIGLWREACLDLSDLQALARIVKQPSIEVEDME